MRRTVQGFTLIEIVVALVLVGLLAALAGPLLVGAITGSSKSLQDLGNAVTLQSQMEKITSCYINGTMEIANLKTCVTNNADANFPTVASITGYCKVTGSTISVDASLASGKLYAVTLKSNATGEMLTMLFSEK